MRKPHRPAALLAAYASLGGCTFGTLSSSECMQQYGEAAMFARAQADGSIASEGYSFCADGRRRIDAAIPPLRMHGFEVTEPNNHFEVPGGWCISADRRVSPAAFDPMKSLETVCAIGDASRSYLTGGSFVTPDGKHHGILPKAEREAREEIIRRIEQHQRVEKNGN